MMKKLVNKYKGLSIPAKASLWYTFANVLLKGIALLSTPIFTRVMSTNEYGTFSIFQSWYGIILIFTSLNIFLGGYNKGLLLYKDRVDEYTSSSLAQTSLITIVWWIIYKLNTKFWGNIFELSPLLMNVMFLELLIFPAYEFWASKSRFFYKYKTYVFTSILMSILSVGFGIIAVINSPFKVEARVFTDVFAKVSIAFALYIYLISKGKIIFNKIYWKYNLKFNIPLIPHYLSMYALNQSDRIMISKMVGNSQAAFYSVAYNIAMMMNLILTAINNALTPYIYLSIEKKETKSIKKNTTPIFVVMAILCIIAMIFAPEIIYLFAGTKYSEAIYVIPPVAASVYFIFVYSMFSTVEYYYQKTVNIAIATSFAAILNIILNFIFISLFGYYAAGYTTLVGYILLAILHYHFYRGIIRTTLNGINELYDEKVIVITAMFLLILMVIITLTYTNIILRYSLVVIILIFLYANRKRLMEIMQMIKKG